MRIAIELSEIFRSYRGWRRYTLELTKALVRQTHDLKFDFFYHCDSDGAYGEVLDQLASPHSFFHPVSMPFAAYDALEMSRSHSFLDDFLPKSSLYHAMTEFPFHVNRLQKVVTIHEISPLLFPNHFSAEWLKYFQQTMVENYDTSDCLVTVSANTAAEFQRYFSVPPHKFSVILNGVADEFFMTSRAPDPNVGILYIGPTKDPLKNFAILAHIFKDLPDRRMTLVSRDITDLELETLYGLSPEARSRISIISNADDVNLLRLYQSANVFVFPSLHEGFGLPVLEALAIGCPVVCGDHSALREVHGGFAAICDVTDDQAMLSAIRSCWSASVRDRVAQGRAFAKNLTWDHTAKAYLRLYEAILKSKNNWPFDISQS